MDRDGPAQSRVGEALLTLLDLLGRHEPVLLAIEDLHWADASTRAFLSFLGPASVLNPARLLPRLTGVLPVWMMGADNLASFHRWRVSR